MQPRTFQVRLSRRSTTIRSVTRKDGRQSTLARGAQSRRECQSGAPTPPPVTHSPVDDEQPRPRQVQPVLIQRDPHRHRQIPRTTTELVIGQRGRRPRSPALHRARPTASHDRNALERLERPDEHRGRRVLRFSDHVDEVVDAVVEVDVRETGRTIERSVAAGSARRRMAGRVGLANVRLDLDDRTRW